MCLKIKNNFSLFLGVLTTLMLMYEIYYTYVLWYIILQWAQVRETKYSNFQSEKFSFFTFLYKTTRFLILQSI